VGHLLHKSCFNSALVEDNTVQGDIGLSGFMFGKISDLISLSTFSGCTFAQPRTNGLSSPYQLDGIPGIGPT